MTDLLTRLRQLPRAEHDDLDVVDEAVEEIVNLRTDVHVLRELLERYKHDSALQSHKPKPNDLMLSGVLRMPFKMAMATELSRYQFYLRAQQALNELEALQSQDREDAERYRWLRLQRSITDLACVTWNIGHDWVQMDGAELDAAIDHARRAEE